MPGWYKACELASLSSKSDSTFVDDRVQGTLWLVYSCVQFAVQLIGKLWVGPSFQ